MLKPMIGAAIVTPTDILAYRQMWDEYVLDTVRVMYSCAGAYQSLSVNPSTSPVDAATMQALATQLNAGGVALYAQWNVFANTSSATIVLEGATILQSFQTTVQAAGAQRQTIAQGQCSLSYATEPAGQLVSASPPPDPATQVTVIQHIEGLGILAAGLLEILGETTGYGLQTIGSAAQVAAQLAHGTASWILSPWTWGIAATLLVGTVAVVVYNADKVARLATAVRP